LSESSLFLNLTLSLAVPLLDNLFAKSHLAKLSGSSLLKGMTIMKFLVGFECLEHNDFKLVFLLGLGGLEQEPLGLLFLSIFSE